MSRIRAAIYDMDGLLIDSEPFWHKAETEVFASVGIQLTPAMCLETVGLRMDAIVQHWFERYPWNDKTHAEVGSGIARRVAELVALEARLLPGVEASIAFCRERALALAV